MTQEGSCNGKIEKCTKDGWPERGKKPQMENKYCYEW